MFETRIIPQKSDLNAGGHVGFSTLPRWFEKGFEGIYDIINPGRDFTLGFVVVARLEVDYLAEVTSDGAVLITTGIQRMGTRSITLAQELSQQGKPAARALVTLVYFDYNTRSSTAIPDSIREKLSAHMVETVS